MESRNRAVIVLVISILLALAIGLAMSWRGQQSEKDTSKAADAVATAPQAVPTQSTRPARQIPEPRKAAALPSTDAPLHRVVAELKRRVAEGDHAATCRLASEYLRCSQLRVRRTRLDRWLGQQQRALGMAHGDGAAEAISAAIESEMRHRQTEIDQLASHCGTVPVPAAPEIARLWRKSALAGNPAALKQYASGNAFRWESMLEALPELATYRREAEHFATVAASRGDMDLLLALAAGYDPAPTGSRTMLAQSLRPDVARALALYRHAEAVLAADPPNVLDDRSELRDRIATLEQSLSPDQHARASTIARSELARWRGPGVGNGEARNVSGRTPDIQSGRCESGNYKQKGTEWTTPSFGVPRFPQTG